MPNVNNILVYADDRERAKRGLERAAHIARRSGARITALRVLEPAQGPMGRLFSEYGPELFPLLPDSLKRMGAQEFEEELAQVHEKDHHAQLEAWAQPFRESGLRIDVAVRWGSPFVEIIRHAAANHHDLVVKTAMAPEDPGGLSFFGSTAMHLCRKSPVPVWVVSPKDPPKVKRVVAAIDASGNNHEGDDLNRKILEAAARLVELDEGGELHVVRAWGNPTERLMLEKLARRNFEIFEEALRKDADAGVRRIIEQVGVDVLDERIHLVSGAARTAIPSFARDLGAETLVMGSVGRGGVPGLVIGETAEAILQRVAYSVLVVKPEGFTSPVLTSAA